MGESGETNQTHVGVDVYSPDSNITPKPPTPRVLRQVMRSHVGGFYALPVADEGQAQAVASMDYATPHMPGAPSWAPGRRPFEMSITTRLESSWGFSDFPRRQQNIGSGCLNAFNTPEIDSGATEPHEPGASHYLSDAARVGLQVCPKPLKAIRIIMGSIELPRSVPQPKDQCWHLKGKPHWGHFRSDEMLLVVSRAPLFLDRGWREKVNLARTGPPSLH